MADSVKLTSFEYFIEGTFNNLKADKNIIYLLNYKLVMGFIHLSIGYSIVMRTFCKCPVSNSAMQNKESVLKYAFLILYFRNVQNHLPN